MAPDVEAVADRTPLAPRYFTAWMRSSNLEDALDNAVLRAFGADPEDTTTWPCGDVVYDWYDESFELRGTRNDYPVPTDLSAVWALGFARGWICFIDGTEVYVSGTVTGTRKPGHHGGESEESRLVRQAVLRDRQARA